MKLTELRVKTEKELAEMVKTLQEKRRDLRFQLQAGKVKNTREIHDSRKTIARIQTILQERSK